MNIEMHNTGFSHNIKTTDHCVVNNIDYIIAMAPAKGWDMLGSKNSQFLNFMCRK